MVCLHAHTPAAKAMSAGGALLVFCLVFFALFVPGSAQAAKSLRAFASEEELNGWLQEKKKRFEEEMSQRRMVREKNLSQEVAATQAPMAPPGSAQALMAPAAVADTASESVTNVQTAGVDEGGIVKVHKDHLVVLRRGRLFTVRIGANALQPVDMQDAFAPGSSGHAWYDEMLISGNTVIVIGYSYTKGGTEVVLFGIGDDGRLSYHATYVLRSNDYYSSRNYASRLIGNTLIFYTPLYLNFSRNPLDSFPGAFRWQRDEKPDFRPIAPATRIYRSPDDLEPTKERIALHTVTTCEVAGDRLDCSASAVLGPAGREFYVARDAVYVWTASFQRGYGGSSAFERIKQMPVSASVFRLPLNSREAPTALKTFGSPIDQFSFLESADGYLNVLVRAEGPVPSMWASEQGSHDIALLRTPLRDFGDGSTSAKPEHYHPLPAPKGGSSLQNRYIGDYLVYGAGQTWRRGQESAPHLAYFLRWSNPGEAESISLPHRVDRIEALGEAALLVGGKEKDLYFSILDLPRKTPSTPRPWWRRTPAETEPARVARIADTFMLKDAAQGETRSHGFFYKPDAEDSGLLGLPYASSERTGRHQLRQVSSGVIFLQNDKLRLSEVGALTTSSDAQSMNDQCKASCMDWYGNSRPLFVAGRVFALMGYEIVEGKLTHSRLEETRRINFFLGREGR